jgi:hypothetical protein
MEGNHHRQTAAAFDEAAGCMSQDAWQRPMRYTVGQERRAEVIAQSCLAEVLSHRVDLDIGYCPADWLSEFVEDMLPRAFDRLSHPAEAVPHTRLDATDAGRAFTVGTAGAAAVIVRGRKDLLSRLCPLSTSIASRLAVWQSVLVN